MQGFLQLQACRHRKANETAEKCDWMHASKHGRFVDTSRKGFNGDAEHLLSCPYTSPHTDIQPTVEIMLVAWMQHACRGLVLGQSWKSAEGGFLKSKAMTATT